MTAKTSKALVRVQLYQDGYQAGLIDTQLYGVYECPPAGETTVTYGWQENGNSKSHSEVVPAGEVEHSFDVPTGTNVVDEFVRISVP